MPFIAERADGEVVAAARADVGDDHRCLECGQPIVLRSAHRREGELVRPHFMHPGGDEGCSSGESEEHRWMKSLAYAAAEERWPESNIEYEGVVGERRADVLVSGPNVAIEVQYRHLDKDIEAAVFDYSKSGYSTLLLHERHFSDGFANLDGGTFRKNRTTAGNLVGVKWAPTEWHWCSSVRWQTACGLQIEDERVKHYISRYLEEADNQLSFQTMVWFDAIGSSGPFSELLTSRLRLSRREVKDGVRCQECHESLIEELGHR